MTATKALNPEQQEIVELLCGELAEILSADNAPLYETGSERQAFLNDYAAQVEQLGKAMELAGLSGLSVVCEHLSERFTDLANNGDAFSEDLIDLLSSWSMILLNFLHQFIDEESDAETLQEATKDVINYIANGDWPQQLSEEQLIALQKALSASQIKAQDDANTAPVHLDQQSCSLATSDDVRPELLQGLLAELPEQSRTFEQSVSEFLRAGSIQSLIPAQRIAHTIKGSANIVGIRGLANLMHFCEDFFEQITKGHVAPEKLQSVAFNDLLIDTADCLGDISDFLAGLGPEPNQVLSVLQQLQHFQDADFNPQPTTHAEDESASNADGIAVPVAADSTPGESTPATESAPTGEEDEAAAAHLSLSQAHAQQLLRLAGESQIANTQFMAQLETMKTSIEQTERYHRRIKSMAMELEALLQTQNALRSAMYRSRAGEHTDSNQDFDPLELESYSELHSFSNQLLELTADSYEAVGHIEEQIDNLTTLAYTQRQLNRDNNDLLLRTHMVSVDSIVPRLQRCVRQACRLTQKNASLEVIGANLQIDNRVLSGIVDPLMHLLRNAVDHGIESDEDRMAADKDATGKITVEFVQQGEIIHIHCRDDGRGLDWETIRQKAQDKKLLAEDDTSDSTGLSRLLFLPGFSTRDNVSQTSGRGIGLDVVHEAVQKLKGFVHVNNNEDGGCCFTLSVPASILTAHTLLVKMQHNRQVSTLSVLSRGIDNIIYIEPSQLNANADNLTFHYQEDDIPVFALSDLAGLPGRHANDIRALLIVTREDDSKVAIGVEQLLSSQDLVIKPLNNFTYHPPGVVGATILGDGTVSAVVDLNALPGLTMSREDYARLQAQRAAIAAQEHAQDWQLPTALVIDDSLSARQSLAQFIGELGMQVRTAKDGFEAIAVMNEIQPKIILVDLEMPRMNGLEFTAHLRADENNRDIPVIMITSRSTDKHRQLAEKAGVDDYLNKPWSDEALLSSIQRQMESKKQLTANG